MPKKVKSRKTEDDLSKLDGATKVKYAFILLLIVGGGLASMMPLFEVIWEELQGSGYVNLAPSGDSLEEVFFSGKPWLVLCKGAKQKTPKLWRTTGRVMMKDVAKPFNMGVLDCNATLPSGKTTYERFPLRINENRLADTFFVSNGNKPTIVPDGYWNVPSPSEQHAQALFNYVKKQTKMRKAKAVTNTDGLKKHCLNYPKCVLVLHNGQMNAEKKTVFDHNQGEFRNLRWATLDISKKSMSLQKALPLLPVRSEEEAAGEPRVIAFKSEKQPGSKKKVLHAKALVEVFSLDHVDNFLQNVYKRVKSGEEKDERYEMKRLSSMPKVGAKGAKFNNKKKKKAKQAAPLEEDVEIDLDTLFEDTDTSETAEDPKITRQQKPQQQGPQPPPKAPQSSEDSVQERRIAEERRRREEMDKEAFESAAYARAVEENDEDDEEDEEDEEDIMDLDEDEEEEEEGDSGHIEL